MISFFLAFERSSSISDKLLRVIYLTISDMNGEKKLYYLSVHVYNFVLASNSAPDGKVSAYSAGDQGSIPGSGRSSGEGNGNPLQYSCLENLMDGGNL